MNQNFQPTVKEAQQWANALRSGKHKQGKGKLQNNDGTVCCLGVGCLTFIPDGLRFEIGSKTISGGTPITQPHAPIWLKKIDRDLGKKMGIPFSVLNDREDYSFDEIADIIELIYVHKVLEESK